MVLGCQDLPLWPQPNLAGPCWRRHGDVARITPPSSPAPQAPLGSRGTRGRKEALCLGRGRPGTASKGPPPGPRMWRHFETPGTRVPGAAQSCLCSSCPCPHPPVPAWGSSAPPRILPACNDPSVSQHCGFGVDAITGALAHPPPLQSTGFLWANPRVKECGELSSPSSPRGAQIPMLHP